MDIHLKLVSCILRFEMHWSFWRHYFFPTLHFRRNNAFCVIWFFSNANQKMIMHFSFWVLIMRFEFWFCVSKLQFALWNCNLRYIIAICVMELQFALWNCNLHFEIAICVSKLQFALSYLKLQYHNSNCIFYNAKYIIKTHIAINITHVVCFKCNMYYLLNNFQYKTCAFNTCCNIYNVINSFKNAYCV
jgi:hypothetical protein